MVGLHSQLSIITALDADVAQQVAERAWSVDTGLAHRRDSVLEHALALAPHERDRQIALEVLAGDDFVEAVLDEQFGPTLELFVIETLDVLVIQLFNLVAQISGVDVHKPMTSR